MLEFARRNLITIVGVSELLCGMLIVFGWATPDIRANRVGVTLQFVPTFVGAFVSIAGALLLFGHRAGLPLSIMTQLAQVCSVSIKGGAHYFLLAGLDSGIRTSGTAVTISFGGGGGFYFGKVLLSATLSGPGFHGNFGLTLNKSGMENATTLVGINIVALWFAIQLIRRWSAERTDVVESSNQGRVIETTTVAAHSSHESPASSTAQ